MSELTLIMAAKEEVRRAWAALAVKRFEKRPGHPVEMFSCFTELRTFMRKDCWVWEVMGEVLEAMDKDRDIVGMYKDRKCEVRFQRYKLVEPLPGCKLGRSTWFQEVEDMNALKLYSHRYEKQSFSNHGGGAGAGERGDEHAHELVVHQLLQALLASGRIRRKRKAVRRHPDVPKKQRRLPG
jgi:hypothetical protein